jgi:hypothetical protein
LAAASKRPMPTKQMVSTAIAAGLRFATYGRCGCTADRRIGRNRDANASFDILRATNDFSAATATTIDIAHFLTTSNRAALDDRDIRGVTDCSADGGTRADGRRTARLSSAAVACVGDVS